MLTERPVGRMLIPRTFPEVDASAALPSLLDPALECGGGAEPESCEWASFLPKALKKKLDRREAPASLPAEEVRDASGLDAAEDEMECLDEVSSSCFCCLLGPGSPRFSPSIAGTVAFVPSTAGHVQLASSTAGNSWRHATASFTNCSGDFFRFVKLERKDEPPVGIPVLAGALPFVTPYFQNHS